jgi:hypothetical protein
MESLPASLATHIACAIERQRAQTARVLRCIDVLQSRVPDSDDAVALRELTGRLRTQDDALDKVVDQLEL